MGDINEVKKTIENLSNKYKDKIDWDDGLWGACEGGNIDIVNLMIYYGADNWENGLWGSCEGGHIDIVNMMIKKGAYNWNHGLWGACGGGHIDIVNMMIENGADDWNSGLWRACEKGHINIVNLMIKKGADSLDLGLYKACKRCHINLVNYMIEKGGKINIYFSYPKYHNNIIALLELGLNINKLLTIKGIDILVNKLKQFKEMTYNELYQYMPNELVNLVSQYCLL